MEEDTSAGEYINKLIDTILKIFLSLQLCVIHILDFYLHIIILKKEVIKRNWF